MDDVAPVSIKSCVMCNREFTEDTTFCPHDGGLLTPLKRKPGPGAIIGGRYEIVASLGEGGMGEVFQARDRMLKRFVALKMLKSHFNSSSTTLLRFQQEAETVSSLSHPNIVSIHDFGVTATGEPYIIMDFIDGMSLESALCDGPLSIERACPIFVQICSALMQAHQRGIVHRDIKPSNILLTDLHGHPDFVKVIDFGIAKLTDVDHSSLTRTGDVFGSPQYMSPEQCRGHKPDERSDIYSLGCLMYRTVSGRLPFTALDPSEYIYKHIHEPVPPLEDELSLPTDFRETILRCLQKDPADRFQNMQELRDAFGAPNMTPLPAAVPGAAMHASPFRPTKRRIVLISLSLMLLAAVAGYAIFSMTKTVPPNTPKMSEAQIKQILYSDKAWSDPARKARSYWYQGDYLHAIPYARQASEAAKKYGQTDPRSAFSLYMLGLFDWAQGDYESAGRKLEEALTIRKEIYSPRAPEIADSEVSLGVALADLGDYKRAQEMIDDSASIREDKFGANSLPYAETMYADGYLAQKQGKFDRAVKLMTEALYMIERADSATKADIADGVVDLADAYREWGNYSTAEMLYKRALVTEKPDAGSAKLYVAKAYSGLANIYSKRREYPLAITNANKAIQYFDQQLGPVNIKSAEMRKLIDDAPNQAMHK